MTARGLSNKYCALATLRNESDVEQFFVLPLLADLGYGPTFLQTKASIPAATLGKGRARRQYSPDYLAYTDQTQYKLVLIVDAKHPNEAADTGVTDAQMYASVIRRRMPTPKPDQYCIGVNGHQLIVKHYDTDIALFTLQFSDFIDGNPAFDALRKALSRAALAHAPLATSSTPASFVFQKPDTREIRGLFEACHDVIWRREFESPVPAFWEFCKLMFIKLHEDALIHSDTHLESVLQAGQPLPADQVVFSTLYIDRTTNASNPNPIAALFETIRNELESQILSGRKKRIFDTHEQLKLSPLTIRRVVGLLEHYDLIRIDEDLNGRLFQTFLSATMRGKQLGQFFTPRTVVDFMCDLAGLTVTKEPPYVPYIIDACCGTGGFLIEAMAKLTAQLTQGPLANTMTMEEKAKIENIIKEDRLFGIDAGKDPPVARIARINMYLHGDGGSRIYSADALDKRLQIPATTPPEIGEELRQLRDLLCGPPPRLFDIALTNPPFSMKKEAKEEDQREILEEYEAAYIGKPGARRLRASLKSNVMFLERYQELLKPGGRLITVIDESVLNTGSDADHRARLFLYFYIRAIISLPQDAFADAGANVKTSILVLDRKTQPSEDQPVTFYGRSDNIGYRGARLNEALSDLPTVLLALRAFERTGDVATASKGHWTDRNQFFAVRLSELRGRMDLEWHDPRHTEMAKRLQEIAQSKGYIVQTLGGSEGLCDFIVGKAAEEYVSDGVPILKVRNITGEGINWNSDFVLQSFFDASPAAHLEADDVLVTTTGLGTIGRVDVLEPAQPCMTDAHVTALRLRGPQRVSPDFLAHYLRSPLGQMQMERFTVGCTGQTELNNSDLAKLKVIYPAAATEQAAALREAKRYEAAARRARDEHLKNRALSRTEFERGLGL